MRPTGVGLVMVTSLVWRRTVFPGPEDGRKAVLVTDIGEAVGVCVASWRDRPLVECAVHRGD